MSVGRVVVVGAVNVDMVVEAQRLPAPGETVVGAGVQRFGGGKGANAAVAAARAGATVALVGAVGADETGRSALHDLRADGVDTSAVAVLDGQATGVALIVVDSRGENQIAVGAGANAVVSASAVTAAIVDAACVLVSTEIPGTAVAAAVRAAIGAGAVCILNPAPVIAAVADLLGAGPILTPNRSECMQLAAQLDGGEIVRGSGGPPPGGVSGAVLDAARHIQSRTGAPVVVTLGGDGAVVLTPGGGVAHVPSPPSTVRDTTGAGDTFNGVLAARLAAGDELDRAVRVAVAAASLSVARTGARAGMPTAAAIAAATP